MRICHIITRLIIGGAQENTLLTCQGLHERGHEVSLLTGPETGPEGSLLDEAAAGGYGVTTVPELRRAIGPVQDRRAYTRLRALLGELRPHVVHTHSSKAGILGRLAARVPRGTGFQPVIPRPVIVHTIHGMSFNRTQGRLKRLVFRQAERYCAGFTDRILTVADAMTRQAVDAGLAPPDRFETVYSGMRTDWYDPARYDRDEVRRGWGFGPEHVVAGAVARLFDNKGYEQLIPAMAEAAQQLPELRFVWVGDGNRRAAYERRLVELGLRDRVYLTGLVPPEAVARLLAGMDLLVHASQWEGLPRAAVQASLIERPVISFDIDGAPEVVIPGRTGVLVPLNDVAALARAMVALAGDAEERRRLGAAARALCLERFDQEMMVAQIERIYEELLRRERGHS